MSETKYLSYKQACSEFGVCRNTLMKYDRPGITFRIGRCVRFDREALLKAFQAEEVVHE